MKGNDNSIEKYLRQFERDEPQYKTIYFLLIFLMKMHYGLEFDKKWSEFSKEILSINRFNISHPVISDIIDNLNKSPLKLSRNSTLYRAQKTKNSALEKYIYQLFATDGTLEGVFSLLDKWLSIDNKSDVDAILTSKDGKNFCDEFMKCKKSGFWGLNKKYSGAPPAEKTKSNRANPQGIRYLYAAEDTETTIAEVRPTINERVSIATLKTKKTLRLADLTSDKNTTLARIFSKVALGDEETYLPMQYLAERIKISGFDGIRYKSSLHDGGVNIVLFNPNSCKITSSELRTIDKILYQSSRQFPFERDQEDMIHSVYNGDYGQLITTIATIRDELKKSIAGISLEEANNQTNSNSAT